ncbi:MAG: AI-2E family transporter [Bacteroidetes bacterium]|nr:AI-2E family transporter [Bacteroidota bacterium]
MSKNLKTTILYGILILTVVFVIWQATSILFYLLISCGIGVLGNKIAGHIEKIKIKKKSAPRWTIAIGIICMLYFIILAVASLLIPIISHEIDLLSQIDYQMVLDNLQEPLTQMEPSIRKFTGQNDFSMKNYASEKLSSVIDASTVSYWINGLASLTGNLLIAIFSISFMSFFFIKDGVIIYNTLLSYLSEKSRASVKKVIDNSLNQLSRYFIGVLIEVFFVFLLTAAGLWIIGVEEFIIIALFAAFLNIIPYVGPLSAMAIASVVIISSSYDLPFYAELLPLLYKSLGVMIIVQMIDAFFLQPYIYSSSVNAHPLEIFLIILLTGNIAGVSAMMFAIPAYTILRIIAKEFIKRPEIISE